MSPDDPRHGTEAGHEQHLRDSEVPCDACRHGDLLASRRRSKRKAMGHVYMLPLGQGLHARLRELRQRGATLADIAGWAGVAESEVWRYVHGSPDDLVYARTYMRLANMRVGPIVTPVGITRRIQALMWLGYSANVIARESGAHMDTIRDARDNPRCFLARKVREGIVDAYDRLHMRHATGGTKQERAGVTRSRNLALRNDWRPPLAWDDIDDPNERPKSGKESGKRHNDEIDDVRIQRRLSGDQDIRLTPAEAREAIRLLHARGLADPVIAARCGITDRSVLRIRGELGLVAAVDAGRNRVTRRELVEAYDETREASA